MMSVAKPRNTATCSARIGIDLASREEDVEGVVWVHPESRSELATMTPEMLLRESLKGWLGEVQAI